MWWQDEEVMNKLLYKIELYLVKVIPHYNGHIAKSSSKYIVLKISQDGSSITKYHNVLGAARANNIEHGRLKEIISTTRVLNGFIWIKLALS